MEEKKKANKKIFRLTDEKSTSRETF